MKDRIYLKNSVNSFIYEIHNTENLKWEDNLLKLSSLEFDIKSSLYTEYGNIKNPVYGIISENLFIDFKGKTYIITEIIEDIKDEEGVKKVRAFSVEYVLGRRYIVRYEAENRVLYDPDNRIDSDGLHYGIINHIVYSMDIPFMKVQDFPNKAREKRTNLKIDRKSVLELLIELQDIYNCIIDVDIKDGVINIYDIDQYYNENKIKISSKNIIDNILKNLDDSELVTRLWCMGRDGLDISDINITGLPYIDNFDYFKNRGLMSDYLIKNLNKYEDDIKERTPEYRVVYRDFLNKKRELNNNEAVLRLYRGKLEKLYMDYDKEKDEEKKKQIEKDIKREEGLVDILEDRVKDTEEDLEIIIRKMKRLQIDVPSFYKKNKELGMFIIEDVYYTDYGKYDLDKLLEEGEEILKKMSIPTIFIEVSSKELKEELPQEFIDALKLGDIIIIEDDLNDTEYTMRIVGKNYSESTGLSFRFKNAEKIFVDKEYIMDEILRKSDNNNNTVKMNRSEWDNVERVDEEMKKMQESYWAFRRDNLN